MQEYIGHKIDRAAVRGVRPFCSWRGEYRTRIF